MSVFNPAIFIGEAVPGATAGAPLSTDSNGNLASGLPYTFLTQPSGISTTATTFSVITGLSTTPVAGTYLVMFSTSISTTSGVNGSAQTALYLGGTQIAGTVKTSNINVALLLGLIGTSVFSEGASNITYVVTASGSQTIDVRMASPNGVGVTALNSALTLLRLS